MFGILDARTWRALHRLTGSSAFDRGRRTLFKPEEFRRYTRLLRRWSASERAVSPRLIDKALWQYDRSNRLPARMEELRRRQVARSTTLADLSPVSVGRVPQPLRVDDLLGEMLDDDQT